jgi:hypothetical protein
VPRYRGVVEWSLPPGVPRGGPQISDDPPEARALAKAQVAAAAAGLAGGFRRVIPTVVELWVRDRVQAWGRLSAEQRHRAEEQAREMGERAGRELSAAWEHEAALPLWEQRHGPLELLRRSSRYATTVLADAGVSPVRRDAFSLERFPDDAYGLVVERFIDLPRGLGDELHALHLAWGVGRAMWVKADQECRARGIA